MFDLSNFNHTNDGIYDFNSFKNTTNNGIVKHSISSQNKKKYNDFLQIVKDDIGKKFILSKRYSKNSISNKTPKTLINNVKQPKKFKKQILNTQQISIRRLRVNKVPTPISTELDEINPPITTELDEINTHLINNVNQPKPNKKQILTTEQKSIRNLRVNKVPTPISTELDNINTHITTDIGEINTPITIELDEINPHLINNVNQPNPNKKQILTIEQKSIRNLRVNKVPTPISTELDNINIPLIINLQQTNFNKKQVLTTEQKSIRRLRTKK